MNELLLCRMKPVLRNKEQLVTLGFSLLLLLSNCVQTRPQNQHSRDQSWSTAHYQCPSQF